MSRCSHYRAIEGGVFLVSLQLTPGVVSHRIDGAVLIHWAVFFLVEKDDWTLPDGSAFTPRYTTLRTIPRYGSTGSFLRTRATRRATHWLPRTTRTRTPHYYTPHHTAHLPHAPPPGSHTTPRYTPHTCCHCLHTCHTYTLPLWAALRTFAWCLRFGRYHIPGYPGQISHHRTLHTRLPRSPHTAGYTTVTRINVHTTTTHAHIHHATHVVGPTPTWLIPHTDGWNFVTF